MSMSLRLNVCYVEKKTVYNAAVHAPASCEEHQRNEQLNEDNDLTEREKKVSRTTCMSGNMKIRLALLFVFV